MVTDEKGTEDAYYLIAPCRSEHTHSDGQLLTMPNYDFRCIFGEREYTLIRTHWVGNPDYLDAPGFDNTGGRTPVEVGLWKDRWDDVQLDIRTFEDVRELLTDDDIVEQTLRNVPLIGQTELRDETSGLRAVLEYPIKTMNISIDDSIWQVDTGPIAFPDLTKRFDPPVDSVRLAFAVFNAPHFCDFVIEQPTPVVHDEQEVCKVYHYSNPVSFTAKNRVLSVSDK